MKRAHDASRRGLFSSAKLNTKQLFKFGTVPALYPLLSIHAPRAGCDRSMNGQSNGLQRFQSTHPVRGATRRSQTARCPLRHFNPRTPCGVRPSFLSDFANMFSHFNPRTPCGVRRKLIQIYGAPTWEFQSTHPVRGATSISVTRVSKPPNFNPRTPCGVRRLSI